MNWTLAAEQSIENVIMLQHPQINFENFAEFAPELVSLINARVCDKNWGADRHAWVLEVNDINLMLEFEDYTNSIWLAVTRDSDIAQLQALKACFG